MIDHWNCQLKPFLFPLRKNRVNLGHNLHLLSVLELRDVLISIRQSSQTLSVCQSDFVTTSVRHCQYISQTLSVQQSDFVS